MAGSESLIHSQMGGGGPSCYHLHPPARVLPPVSLNSLAGDAAAAVGALQSTAGDTELGGSLAVLRSDTWRQKE